MSSRAANPDGGALPAVISRPPSGVSVSSAPCASYSMTTGSTPFDWIQKPVLCSWTTAVVRPSTPRLPE